MLPHRLLVLLIKPARERLATGGMATAGVLLRQDRIRKDTINDETLQHRPRPKHWPIAATCRDVSRKNLSKDGLQSQSQPWGSIRHEKGHNLTSKTDIGKHVAVRADGELAICHLGLDGRSNLGHFVRLIQLRRPLAALGPPSV